MSCHVARSKIRFFIPGVFSYDIPSTSISVKHFAGITGNIWKSSSCKIRIITDRAQFQLKIITRPGVDNLPKKIPNLFWKVSIAFEYE